MVITPDSMFTLITYKQKTNYDLKFVKKFVNIEECKSKMGFFLANKITQ